MLRKEQKLALYMEGALAERHGKMGFGLLRYSENPIVAIIDSLWAGKDQQEVTRIPRSVPVVATVSEAAALGADVMVLGIAPPGGQIPAEWRPALNEAIRHGLSLMNGLHEPLAPQYSGLRPGQWIWDLRVEPEGLVPGNGLARELANERVLMIGTDMAVGKMTAGLEIHKAALARGVKSAFVATGQIGIAIVGGGVALDAVRIDYAAGAIEREVLSHKDSELVIIEGQGSLIHPGSTANMPLLRGSCPTKLVLCHKAGMTHLHRQPWVQIPPLLELCKLYEDLGAACGTLPRPRTVGVSLNTFGLGIDEANRAIEVVAQETGLVVSDTVRFGGSVLVDAVMAK